MKTNEVRVTIQQPQQDVFEYVVEPKNTKHWVDGSIEMQTDTDQINIGTKYSNEYITRKVTDYENGKFIELADMDGIYSCSYTFRKIDEDSTELIYFESCSDGTNIEYPLEQECFDKLKEILEK